MASNKKKIDLDNLIKKTTTYIENIKNVKTNEYKNANILIETLKKEEY